MRRSPFRLVLWAIPVVFLTFTYLWPLIVLIGRSFEDFGVEIVGDVLGGSRIRRLALFTIVQAVVSTAAAVVFGVPAAWCHARLRFPGRRPLWVASAVPFVLPTIVVAVAFIAVFGTDFLGGGRVGQWVLIIAAHVAVNLAVVVRTVGGRLASISPRLEQSARALGRSGLGAAWEVSFRAAADAVWSAALVVFMFSLTSFGIVLVLGGGLTSTVDVEIWYQTTRLLRLDVAAVLAISQLVIVIAVLVLYELSRRRRGAVTSHVAQPMRRAPQGIGERVLLGCVVVVQLAVVVVPLGALFVESLRVGDRWGVDHYRNLGRALEGTALAVTPFEAVTNSLIVGVAATLISLAVAVPASVVLARPGVPGKVLDLLLMLPLATSAATVGFGILVAYGRPPVDIRGSWIAIPLAEAAIAVPLVVRTLVPVVAGLDRRLDGSAASLGAGPIRRAAQISFPQVRPALSMAAGLAFAVSLGEFGATAFLSRSAAPTLPQVIFRLLGRPGEAHRGQGFALACVLVLLTAGVFAAVESFGRGRTLEF